MNEGKRKKDFRVYKSIAISLAQKTLLEKRKLVRLRGPRLNQISEIIRIRTSALVGPTSLRAVSNWPQVAVKLW